MFKLKVLSAFSVILILIFFLASQTEIWKEYENRALQYATLNKDKNWGIRKSILETTEKVLLTRVEDTHVDFDKNQAAAGAKLEKSDITQYIKTANKVIDVGDSKTLFDSIRRAKAGELILIKKGTYKIHTDTIKIGGAGTKDKPVVIAATKFGDVTININSWEGFLVDRPYWVFKNIIFNGTCTNHKRCEHTFHVHGDADYLLLDNNAFINFNAAIKSNGKYDKKKAWFPDNVTVSNNDIYNTELRTSNSPASPIDVVGGNNWLIENNFIADFSRKVRGNQSIVYGAFLKGGGENGIMRNNVVNCSWKLPYQSSLDIRLGLSLGDGGTGKQFCQVKDCSYEHKGGMIANNIILNCENDVSIYLNKAENTQISGNIMLNSLGVDARFKETNLVIRNNVIQGRTKSRDGAKVDDFDNTYISELDDIDMISIMDALSKDM